MGYEDIFVLLAQDKISVKDCAQISLIIISHYIKLVYYGWGSCGRLGRAAGGGDGLDVGNQKWWVCKVWFITCEPNLVASVPGKCIKVAQEF